MLASDDEISDNTSTDGDGENLVGVGPTTVSATTCQNKVPILFKEELRVGKLLGGGSFCTVSDVQTITVHPEYHVVCQSLSKQNANDANNSEQQIVREKLQKRFQNMEQYKYLYDTTYQTLPTPDPLRPPRLALKRLRPQVDMYMQSGMTQAEVESAARDLEREFQLLRELQNHHPHIISLYAYGYDKPKKDPLQRISFLVLDHLRATLRTRLSKWRNMRGAGLMESMGMSNESLKSSWLERILILSQITSAVAFLHDKRIIHRDINPNNIGFDSDGTVKLFDFGLARFLDHESTVAFTSATDTTAKDSTTGNNTKENTTDVNNTDNNKSDYEVFDMTGHTGTMRYMAPEVYLGNQCGVRSDVYSLGIVYYEVLQLWTPMVHIKGEAAFVQRVIRGGERPAVDSSYWPPQIATLLTAMWHADPTQRPTSRAVTHTVETLLRGPDEHLFPPVGISRFFGRKT